MDNLLLSFPRSGNSWVRYILEVLSKRPTSEASIKDCQAGNIKEDAIGVKFVKDLDIDPKAKCIAIKRHKLNNYNEVLTKNDHRLILLVRNYKEVTIRHFGRTRLDERFGDCIAKYMSSFASYGRFGGDKYIIFYEDLLLHPKKEITALIEFLNISKTGLDGFFENFDSHKEKSVNAYEGSITRGDVTKLSFHAEREGAELVNKISNAIQSEYKGLYNKYLKRYS